ncbi:MAG: penicillin-binding protein 2 [Planctomycetes bacterium]|nr:penicillin-binding protein 2 [Planctomycetota bacterium]
MARALLWMLSDQGLIRSPRRAAAWGLGVIVILMFGLTGRLYSLQVMHHDDYLAQRNANSTRSVSLPGTRGGIYTADNVSLAQTTFSGASIVVNPRAVPGGERAELATRLAGLLGHDGDYARKLEEQLYQRRDKAYYCVQYETPFENIERIRAALRLGELPGVEIRNIETRRYPLGNFASQIVGFVGRDMEGLEGVERALESWLAARPGTRITMVDALGRPIEGMDDAVQSPMDGARVDLTLNSGVQAIVEDELRTCIDRWDPVSATIVVMETHSGAILGIANYPSFDPNDRNGDPASRKNTAITDAFEPGSMIKPIIYARAFEKGLLTPDSLIEYDVELKVQGRRKLVSDKGHEILPEARIQRNGREYVTVRQAIVHSSNTCVARVGMMLGIDEVHDAVTGVGFAQRTGFDMGGTRFGESPGIIRKKSDWTVPNSLVSVCMGYEIQVTPLQMLNCFNTLANGGHVYKPYVIRGVTGADDKMLHQGQPRELLDCWMSEQTALALRPLLADVVNEGTARNALLPQYQIAGKTGTAHKVKDGQYSADKICSFVGFAPAEDPVISIIVVVNEARGRNVNKYGWRIRHYGGTVAAPTVARVVLRTLKHLGVPERAAVTETEE